MANHTSPMDIVILCNDGCYAMVGQSHGGLMGVLQRAMARSCPHIWFERADMKDRHLVAKRLTDHVNDNTKLPILIFPEASSCLSTDGHANNKLSVEHLQMENPDYPNRDLYQQHVCHDVQKGKF